MGWVTTDQLNLINANWKYRTTIDRGNFQFQRYSNDIVSGLWKVTMAQLQPPMFAGHIATTQALAAAFAYESIWTYEKNRNTDGDGIHDNAWPLIDAWKETLEPEPEPVEERPPEAVIPIDDADNILDGFLDGLKGWIQEAILAGLAFLETPLNIIKNLVAKLGQTISGIVSGIKNAISTVMTKMATIFDTIVDKIKGVIDVVWNNIQSIWETLKDMFKTIKQAIVIAFEKSWEFIKKTFTTLWDKMKSGLTYIGESIVSGLKYLWDKIKDALNWVWDILNTAYKSIVDAVTAVWDRFKERLTETIESIKESFGDSIDRLVEAYLRHKEKEEADLEKISTWSEDRIVEFMEFIIGAQRKVLSKLSAQGGGI